MTGYESKVATLLSLAAMLKGRIALNDRTAETHPDPVARREARVRADAYRLVLLDIDARLVAHAKAGLA